MLITRWEKRSSKHVRLLILHEKMKIIIEEVIMKNKIQEGTTTHMVIRENSILNNHVKI